ncbi:MAG: tRNA (adenosine(37)-N6)-threonylcarbamoyltransferase complex dimerization subunit type 1 TsaB [Paracoccus sp. (in: a-proteobacteria)]|nr:tRNA (adenosine(37)-N6)-threonylcarbamoyltransferase complex dimerization subunit type 1 TsaB [Paracoccus sp. (in: a-proteobacteria)]
MPDRLTLGFDTSAAHCAAALLEGRELLGAVYAPMERGQAEQLFPLLEKLLAQGGKNWSDLRVIGVGIGPGNFTGIRISVSAARGLAMSLGIPAVGVSITEALAIGAPRPCRIALSAPRGQVIWQDFAADGRAAPPRIGPRAELPPGPDIHPGTPPEMIAAAIAELAQSRADEPDLPRPAPLYLRPADAAPAKDRGPVILDDGTR